MGKLACAVAAAVLLVAIGCAVVVAANLWHSAVCWSGWFDGPWCRNPTDALDAVMGVLATASLPLVILLVAASVIGCVAAAWHFLYEHCRAFWSRA